MKRPVERGRLILKSAPKRGYCGTCDGPPVGRVRADTAWEATRRGGRLAHGRAT